MRTFDASPGDVVELESERSGVLRTRVLRPQQKTRS
jgi:hypothetical protein